MISLSKGFFVCCLSFLLLFNVSAGNRWREKAAPGKLAPEFILPSIDGSRVRLKDYCGPAKKGTKKAVIIMFFAEWCEICHEKELPDLIKLVKEKDVKDKLQVLAVTIDKEPNQKKYSEMALPFPVLIDRYVMLAPRYGFTNMLPLTVLISPDGRIVKVWEGYKDETIDELKSHVKEILAKFSQYQN